MKMNFNRMAQLHCLASKEFKYIYEHPTSGEVGYLLPFFTTDVGQNPALRSLQKSATCSYPLWDEKSLTFIFLEFQKKKNYIRNSFKTVWWINYDSSHKA
jgi:hypothetical protein